MGKVFPKEGGASAPRPQATDFTFGTPHEGAGRHGPAMVNWNVSLQSADRSWFPDRNIAVARTRDLVRNDVVAASALNRRVNATVGFAWRLCSLVNGRALGLTDDQVRDLRVQIEVAFRHYAYGPTFQCDAESKKTFGQLLRTTAAHIAQDGEALAVIEWAEDEGTRYATRLRMVDPDRLSNPSGTPDSMTLRNGVELSARGAPIAYHIREAHPNDVDATSLNAMRWRRVPRYATAWRRPQVLHAFDGLRAGQTRGVSRFVAALKQFRALSKFTDATLQAVTINALLVGFIKSNAGFNAVSESFQPEDLQKFHDARDQFWDGNSINLESAKLPVLPPGDEVDLATTSRETAGFDAFLRAMLRLIAAALGVTYEELSMDFSQTTYSSCRAAMAIAWTETLAMRGLISAQVATPFFLAWLEEAFEIGAVKLPANAPDFYENMDAYAECKWIGPARGYIDPTKEIDAAAGRIEAGMSSLQDECDEQGKDWEEVALQRAYEKGHYESLGMPYPGVAADNAGAARDPYRDTQLDTPPPKAAARDRIHETARSDHHNAALDAPAKP